MGSYSKKAEPTIRRMMTVFPTLFQRRQQALNTLLFSIGTGYWWKDGCLVNPNDSPEGRARAERYARAREKSVIEWMKRNPGRKRNIEQPAPQPVPVRDRWNVPCEYSPLVNIPRNVDPSWVKVCIEACDAFLKAPMKDFDASRQEVREARKRVADILAILRGL